MLTDLSGCRYHGDENRENPRRLRTDLPVHPCDADDLHAQRASVARARSRHARPAAHTPARSITPYIDGFGNKCARLAGAARPAPHRLRRHRRRQRPARSRRPLGRAACRRPTCRPTRWCTCSASRYCETDLMMDNAWELFGATPPGWAPGAGDLRFRARAHQVRLPGRRLHPRRRATASPSSAACAATSRIWRSRSAAA